jgi:hypothetical protein
MLGAGITNMTYAPSKALAHELIERMPQSQVPVAVDLLVKMLHPVDLALANAPFEDEEISAEEKRDAAAAKAEISPSTSMDDLLMEFGVSREELSANPIGLASSRES